MHYTCIQLWNSNIDFAGSVGYTVFQTLCSHLNRKYHRSHFRSGASKEKICMNWICRWKCVFNDKSCHRWNSLGTVSYCSIMQAVWASVFIYAEREPFSREAADEEEISQSKPVTHSSRGSFFHVLSWKTVTIQSQRSWKRMWVIPLTTNQTAASQKLTRDFLSVWLLLWPWSLEGPWENSGDFIYLSSQSGF